MKKHMSKKSQFLFAYKKIIGMCFCYARSKEECERLLTEMIEQVKAGKYIK